MWPRKSKTLGVLIMHLVKVLTQFINVPDPQKTYPMRIITAWFWKLKRTNNQNVKNIFADAVYMLKRGLWMPQVTVPQMQEWWV